MNLWTPIAACSLVAFAVATGCVVHEGPPPAAPPPAPAPVVAGGGGCGNQPFMAQALSGLRSARGSLDKAEHNKGGWRDAAIAATDNAIRETERGCAFAER